MRKKKYDVWFSFGINLELDDPEDYSEAARKGKEKLLDRINSDSIADSIDDIVKYDDRENPCDNCEDGDMIQVASYPTQFETISVYQCDSCFHRISFP